MGLLLFDVPRVPHLSVERDGRPATAFIHGEPHGAAPCLYMASFPSKKILLSKRTNETNETGFVGFVGLFCRVKVPDFTLRGKVGKF
jgi:hypothetical protein